LGSGNHFIEIDRGEHGELYLVVHSGSRYLDKEVCEYYQEKAYHTLCGCTTDGMNNAVNAFAKDLAYVAGQDFEDYIHDMKIMQRFAVLNRKAMIETIITGMGLTVDEEFTTIHNYIETDRMILRIPLHSKVKSRIFF
jgi:RNA-splicing ligase RtcB